MRHPYLASAFVSILALAATSLPASADSIPYYNDTKALRDAVKVPNILAHERALQGVANRHNGTRASGTPGFEGSLRYVKRKLEEAGYFVNVLPFQFTFFEENSPSTLEKTNPNPTVYTNGVDFLTMSYSGDGDVTAQLQNAGGFVLPPTPEPSSASGCDPADFDGFVAGRIALIQRGTCTFEQKAANAQAAGASAVLIFNEGNPGRTDLFGGTLGRAFTLPVLSLPFELGETLAGLTNPTMHVTTDVTTEIRPTANLMAETRRGDPNNVVVVGAHLDSVLEGPGIEDNGTGSSTILEIAIQLAKLRGTDDGRIRNKIRFMWYGAEESGLLGSEDYVSKLTPGELDSIALMLNFDMIASPNFVRFVYDGNGNETGTRGPKGSALIENVFLQYFRRQRLETDATAFDGRSDYGPFIEQGIPAGGLFTGAEGLKTAEQAKIYGGTVGVAYDACYHQACDDINNLNNLALNQMSDAAAHAVLHFGRRPFPERTATELAERRASKVARSSLLYRGPQLQK